MQRGHEEFKAACSQRHAGMAHMLSPLCAFAPGLLGILSYAADSNAS